MISSSQSFGGYRQLIDLQCSVNDGPSAQCKQDSLDSFRRSASRGRSPVNAKGSISLPLPAGGRGGMPEKQVSFSNKNFVAWIDSERSPDAIAGANGFERRGEERAVPPPPPTNRGGDCVRRTQRQRRMGSERPYLERARAFLAQEIGDPSPSGDCETKPARVAPGEPNEARQEQQTCPNGDSQMETRKKPPRVQKDLSHAQPPANLDKQQPAFPESKDEKKITGEVNFSLHPHGKGSFCSEGNRDGKNHTDVTMIHASTTTWENCPVVKATVPPETDAARISPSRVNDSSPEPLPTNSSNPRSNFKEEAASNDYFEDDDNDINNTVRPHTPVPVARKTSLPGYDLGQSAWRPSHMYKLDHRAAVAAAEGLKIHEFAFVRRSDRTWTYCIVADLPVIDGEPSIRFVVNWKASTKTVGRRHWGKAIRPTNPFSPDLDPANGDASAAETDTGVAHPVSEEESRGCEELARERGPSRGRRPSRRSDRRRFARSCSANGHDTSVKVEMPEKALLGCLRGFERELCNPQRTKLGGSGQFSSHVPARYEHNGLSTKKNASYHCGAEKYNDTTKAVRTRASIRRGRVRTRSMSHDGAGIYSSFHAVSHDAGHGGDLAAGMSGRNHKESLEAEDDASEWDWDPNAPTRRIKVGAGVGFHRRDSGGRRSRSSSRDSFASDASSVCDLFNEMMTR